MESEPHRVRQRLESVWSGDEPLGDRDLCSPPIPIGKLEIPYKYHHIGVTTMANVVQSAKAMYSGNRLIKWVTNTTAVLALFGMIGGGIVQGASFVDDRYVKVMEYKALKENQDASRKEQSEQRSLLERQGRQLDFIYLDSLKRDRDNVKRELLELRRLARTSEIEARIGQLVDDLRAIEIRVREQEDLVRGRTR